VRPGFVHLAVHKGHFRFCLVFKVDNLGFDHFVIEVVTFTGTLTYAGKHGEAAMCLGDVVDEFHDEYGFAYACTAKRTNLTALCVRREQIDDLNAGDEDFAVGRLVDECRGFSMDRRFFLGFDRTTFVNRFADDVDDAAERFRADRNGNRRTGIPVTS